MSDIDTLDKIHFHSLGKLGGPIKWALHIIIANNRIYEVFMNCKEVMRTSTGMVITFTLITCLYFPEPFFRVVITVTRGTFCLELQCSPLNISNCYLFAHKCLTYFYGIGP